MPRFLDRLGLLRSGGVRRVRLRNGLVMTVRTGTSDFGVLDDIFLFGVYDRALRRIRQGDVVLDIGAQAGTFAVAAAAHGARVSCFEPLESNLSLLEENARLNGYADKIRGYKLAVAGTPGDMELYVVEADTGGATFFPSIHPEWERHATLSRATVQCVTLADIFALLRLTECDVVKMDCEGAEYDIIQHAGPAELRRIRSLVMEYHPNGDIRAVGLRLEQLGFGVEICDNPCILYAAQDVVKTSGP